MKRYIRTLLLLLVCGSTLLQANGTALTLDDALALALEKNPQLKGLEQQVDVLYWKRLEALSGHLPFISANATQFVANKYAKLRVRFDGQNETEFPTAYPQTTLELEGSLLLFDGLATINNYLASNLLYDAGKLEASRAKFRLTQTVRNQFHKLLAAQEMNRVSHQNLDTLKEHLRLAKVSEKAGTGVRVDVLRIESQLEEANAEQLLAEDNIIIARNAFAEVLGIESEGVFVQGALPIPETNKVPASLALDLSERDDLQAQLLKQQAQQHLNQAATATWVPKISFFSKGQLYRYDASNPRIVPTQFLDGSYAVGFKLSWNIFDGGIGVSRKMQAIAVSNQSGETTRSMELASPNEFDLYKRRYHYNVALYHAKLRSVTKSQESLRLAFLGVKAGSGSHAEAIDTELELFRARAGVVRAQSDAAEALSNLELALGHSL